MHACALAFLERGRWECRQINALSVSFTPRAAFQMRFSIVITSCAHARSSLSVATYPLAAVSGRRNKCRGSFARFPKPPVLDLDAVSFSFSLSLSRLRWWTNKWHRLYQTWYSQGRVERARCQKVTFYAVGINYSRDTWDTQKRTICEECLRGGMMLVSARKIKPRTNLTSIKLAGEKVGKIKPDLRD